MQNIANLIRDFDLFAVPVSLTYKGKRFFGTLAGGCFSLLLIMLFLTDSIWRLHIMMVNPELKSSFTKIYFPYTDDATNLYNITTLSSTLAVAVNSTRDDTNTILQVVFKQGTPENPDGEFVPAVNCSDFFKSDMISQSDKAFFDSTFSDEL